MSNLFNQHIDFQLLSLGAVNYPSHNTKTIQFSHSNIAGSCFSISIVGFSWLMYCWWFGYFCSQRRLSTVLIMQNERNDGERMIPCSLRGIGCSGRGLEFDYKHPHINIQHSVTSVPNNSASSPGVENQVTTYTNKIKINKSL